MLADGYHDIPPGKVAAVVTHLEMRARPALKEVTLPEGVVITPVNAPECDWYRDLFLRVGGQDWLWFSRLVLDDAALQVILQNPEVHIFTVEKDGRPSGLLELDFRKKGACELAYFGLTSDLIGAGVGRALMNRAIAEAWARPITRFHLQTCTLDSPQALSFYRRSGFVPVRQQIEIANDPRLTGKLPRDAAQRVPIIYQAEDISG